MPLRCGRWSPELQVTDRPATTSYKEIVKNQCLKPNDVEYPATSVTTFPLESGGGEFISNRKDM